MSPDQGKTALRVAAVPSADFERQVESDAAQERGEVQRHGGQLPRDVAVPNIPTASDLGLRRDEIYEARRLRDAEAADPGVIRRSLDGMIYTGDL